MNGRWLAVVVMLWLAGGVPAAAEGGPRELGGRRGRDDLPGRDARTLHARRGVFYIGRPELVLGVDADRSRVRFEQRGTTACPLSLSLTLRYFFV